MRPRMGCWFVLCLAAVLLGTGRSAEGSALEGWAPHEVPRCMLLRMELPQGFYAPERAALESDFVNALLATNAVQVVSRGDIDDIVGELKFQTTDLVDPDRAAALGRLMGASHLLTLAVQRVHGQFQVTGRRINVETGEVEKVTVRRSESRVDFLPPLLGDIAYDLAAAEHRKGNVHIESEPRVAQVLLFGVPVGETPVTLRLAPGLYLFTVKKAGYLDRRRTLQVSAGQEAHWTAPLLKRESPRLRDYIKGKSFWGSD